MEFGETSGPAHKIVTKTIDKTVSRGCTGWRDQRVCRGLGMLGVWRVGVLGVLDVGVAKVGISGVWVKGLGNKGFVLGAVGV